MPDYSKTIIYKLCCKNLDVKEIYVGSTCNFTRRKNRHKNDSINSNSKVYKFIRENGGFQNWDMIMIEEYPCENKMQKVKRERYWCEELKSELNSEVPGRTIKEWCQDNKETIKEQKKEYYEKNKSVIDQKHKEYYESNKEKIKDHYESTKEKIKEKRKKYYQENKDKIKQYHEANKDAIKERRKKYYEANKEKLNQKRREYHAKKKIELLKANE